MNRRDFLQTSAAGLVLAGSGVHVAGAESKPPRVGLIGCGWYGKSDLLRLIQVAPVEVVGRGAGDHDVLVEPAEEKEVKKLLRQTIVTSYTASYSKVVC